MRMQTAALALLGVLGVLGPGAAAGQERLTAISGGQVHTVSGEVIENGVVLFQNGKIVDVGANLTVPSDAEVIEAAGRVVTPGIIDARTMFGIDPPDRWETSGPVAPQLRVIESFALPPGSEWLREGVTAVYLTPGPQNVIGGLGAVVKLAGRPGEILVSEAAGMSASLGEVPRQSFGDEAPRTRMGAVGLLREALVRAGEAGRRRDGAARDLGLAALARVLTGELPLRVQANTPEDIMSAVRVGREFDARIVIDVGVGAHQVARQLADADIPVVVGPNIIGAGGGGRFEFALHTEENAARLHRAGVQIALSTDGASGRSVVMEAAVARAHGLPEAEALRAVTLNAATILGAADRLGSVEKGKDADLVIWTAHPLGTWAKAERVIVDGRLVFDRIAGGDVGQPRD